MMKAICHIHTRYSSDSIISPLKLVNYAKNRGIDILLICDHDSFKGVKQARDYASNKGIEIYIPFAAEIKTEYGDIIVVLNDFNEKLDISELKEFDNLIHVIKNKSGIIILPHPYSQHKEVERIAMKVDCIEVFNSRCTVEQNQNALNLCIRFNKIPIYGADAHLYSELNNTIVSYSNFGKNKLFLSSPILLTRKQTQNYKIRLSSLLKAIRNLNFYEMIILTLSVIKWLLIEKVFSNRGKNMGK
ncbi:MAG: PHP domain-containing protein [Actinobacteria bacterium]|nr:PHP domain-containing protein [Actinomycetota bacterium]